MLTPEDHQTAIQHIRNASQEQLDELANVALGAGARVAGGEAQDAPPPPQRQAQRPPQQRPPQQQQQPQA